MIARELGEAARCLRGELLDDTGRLLGRALAKKPKERDQVVRQPGIISRTSTVLGSWGVARKGGKRAGRRTVQRRTAKVRARRILQRAAPGEGAAELCSAGAIADQGPSQTLTSSLARLASSITFWAMCAGTSS